MYAFKSKKTKLSYLVLFKILVEIINRKLSRTDKSGQAKLMTSFSFL